MERVFSERYHRIDFNTLAAENENFLQNMGHLPFPLSFVVSTKHISKTRDFLWYFCYNF